MPAAPAAPHDSIHPGQEPKTDVELKEEPPIHFEAAKSRRSSEHWGNGGLQEGLFDGKTRAARSSIAYIPTPRASRGFHEHDGRMVFDEEFFEQVRLHRQRSRLGKSAKRFSLRNLLDSFRRPSSAAPPVRFSFSRTMKQLRRRLQWRIANLSLPISPEGELNRFRDLVVFGVVVFQLFYIPFAPIYLSHGENSEQNINIATELLLLGHTMLNFNTAVFDPKRLILIESRQDIARRYLSGSFVPDLLGSLPLELISWLARADGDTRTLAAVHPSAYVVENLFRFLWIRQLRRLGKSSWVRGIHGTVGKVCQTLCGVHISVLAVSGKLFGRVVVAAHYLACVLRCILSSFQAVEASSESPIALYTRDLLQVVSTLFGNGWETGHSKADAYSAFLVLVGVMLSAYITSRVAMEVLLGASRTNKQANTPPSSDDAAPPRKGKGFEPVGTSVSQRRPLSRKPSRLTGTPVDPISFNTQRSAFCDSAARTVESTFSKWSEAPQEPASPSVSNTKESPSANPKLLHVHDTSASVESEILQLLKTVTKTVQRLETKVDTLSLNRNSRAAPASSAAPKLHRSKSVQGDGSLYLSRNPTVYPRSIRYQSQERQVPT